MNIFFKTNPVKIINAYKNNGFRLVWFWKEERCTFSIVPPKENNLNKPSWGCRVFCFERKKDALSVSYPLKKIIWISPGVGGFWFWKKGTGNVNPMSSLCLSVCMQMTNFSHEYDLEKMSKVLLFVLNFTEKNAKVLQLSYNLRIKCPTKEEKMSLIVLKCPTIWFSKNSRHHVIVITTST